VSSRPASALLILLIAAVATSFAAAQDPLRGWKVNAKTNALALVAVDESPRDITFFFKNVSGRTITAWIVLFGPDGQDVRRDHLDSFGGVLGGLVPGDAYPVSIGAQEASQYADRTVEVSAVIFADGGSEGSPRSLSYMNHWRLGWMLETERVARLFRTADAGDLDDASIGALTERLGKPPGSPVEALASVQEERLPGVSISDIRRADVDSLRAVFTGIHAARNSGLRKLEELRALPLSSSEPQARTRTSAFSRLRQEYEGLSAKDHAYCERMQGGTRQ
jgi:hypothetical protein